MSKRLVYPIWSTFVGSIVCILAFFVLIKYLYLGDDNYVLHYGGLFGVYFSLLSIYGIFKSSREIYLKIKKANISELFGRNLGYLLASGLYIYYYEIDFLKSGYVSVIGLMTCIILTVALLVLLIDTNNKMKLNPF